MGAPWTAQALLLRAFDRGDDDRSVILLTPDHGRVAALAKHARGSKRRFGASLQAFCLFEASFRSRPGGAVFLEDAQAREFPLGASPGLEALSSGWLLLELAEAFCSDGNAHPAFFELVLGGLRRLGMGAEAPGAVRLSVLSGALALEGWAPDLERCARCGSVPPWPRFSLDALKGGCLCQDCMPPGAVALEEGARQAWLSAFQGRPLGALPPKAEEPLLRWAEYQCGRPLKSAAFALDLPLDKP